jgi:hypothetical protein
MYVYSNNEVEDQELKAHSMTDICQSMAETMRDMYPNASEEDKMRMERDLNAVRSNGSVASIS